MSLPYLISCKALREKVKINRGGSEVKASACKAGDPGSIPGSRKIPWRRQWHPTPVFLPGESHGRRSLVGYSPWGRKESDMTERLPFHFEEKIQLQACSISSDCSFQSVLYPVDFGPARPHNCITQFPERNLLCCSVAESCLTPCNPMDCGMPCLPVLHQSPRVCSNSCPLSQ